MWKSLAICALVWAAACSSSTGAKSPVGTYNLVAIAGAPIPATVGLNTVIAAGAFTLNANGYATITERDSLIGNPGHPLIVNQSSGGKWSVNGSALTFIDTSSGRVSSVYALTSTTITGSGDWLYQR